jgi:hypothetical protein
MAVLSTSNLGFNLLLGPGSVLALICILLFWSWYRRFAHRSLDIVLGPHCDSWLWGEYAIDFSSVMNSATFYISVISGNFFDFLTDGKLGAKWLEAYDSVLRLRNPLGVREP